MKRVIPLVIMLVFVSGSVLAQAPEIRFDLGQRLRAFEQALEIAKPGEKRDRAVVGLKNLTATFFTFQFGKAGQMLDEARLALTRDTVTDADRWASSLTFTPSARLLDVTASELGIAVSAFYSVKAMPPEKASVALMLFDASGKKAERIVAIKEVPAMLMLPLTGLAPGDYRLTAEVRAGETTLATSEQTVSLVDNLKDRLTALRAQDEPLKLMPRSTGVESIRRLIEVLIQLEKGTTMETNFPAHRLLREAEKGAAAVRKETPFYGQKQPGEFWLTLGITNKPRVRIDAPKQVAEGKPLPLVVVQHGAGGSENMFFDGYGDGLVRKLAAERGWLLVSPDLGIGGKGFGGEMLDEIDRLYPVDRSKVFILGHSMGAAATVGAISREPKLYRAAAALGGSGAVKASDDLKKVAVFVAVGTEDFALNGARSLNNALKKAEVATLTLKEYPSVEHLTIVQLALRDVFAFFDASLAK